MLPGEVSVRPDGGNESVKRIKLPRCVKRNGKNDLRKNVQAVLRRLRRFDVFFDDGVSDGESLQQLMRMGGEEEGVAGRADLMACAADPLRRGGDGGGGVDKNDFVNGANVDAEFER